MNDNTKVLIKNLMRYEVGFGCENYRQRYNFQPGQTVPVKWEHLYDVAFNRGFRRMIEEAHLRILPTNDDYKEIMETLQFTHLEEKIEKTLSYEEAKKILSINPLSTQYAKIKDYLKNGTGAAKENIANAAIDIKMKDYTMNEAILKVTGIDVLKTLQLQESPKSKSEEPLLI